MKYFGRIMKSYLGIIIAIDPETQKRYVDYDDDDKESSDFSMEKWRIIQVADRNHENCTIYTVLSSTKQKHSSKNQNPSLVYMIVVEDKPTDPRFLESFHEKTQGLLDRGTYVVVNESDVPPGATVLKPRVVHAIKTDCSYEEKFKTQLIVQGHLDPEKGEIVNEAPTILRSSNRLMLTVSTSVNFKIWSQNVKQAFIQSEDTLHRELCVKPPKRPDLLSMITQPRRLLQAL